MNKLFLQTLVAIVLVSCSKDDGPEPVPNPPKAYEDGILITNEGPFGNGSGTVTFIADDFTNVQEHIFLTENGKDLGNIVQSMAFQDDKAYIVVNNSQKIEIVDRYSFESLGSITTGLNNPRYFIGENLKGYVTNWGDPNDNSDDFLAVIDLRDNSIFSTIPVSFGPEKMVSSNGKIYVAHQGGYGQNNLISVISGNSVQKTITVGDVPNSMVEEDGILYVLCGGNPDYSGNETAGSLVKINLSTNEIIETIAFGNSEHPSGLTEDEDTLFYTLNGKVYKMASTASSLPATGIIDGFFYTIKANDGKLYATDAGDFVSNGKLLVYDLATNKEIQNISVGLIPGGIYFND